MRAMFRLFAERVADAVGTPWAFLLAVAILLAWGASGPFVGFSERWELAVNSFTTIVTFLMVFIIQNTQNRDFKALQVQVDALVLASPNTPRGLIDVQDFSDKDLNRIEHALQRLRGRSSAEEIIRLLETPRQEMDNPLTQ